MTYKNLTPKQTYIISIDPDEEIIETLTRLVKEKSIKSGYLTGLGAVKSARLAHYSMKTKKYLERKIKKPLEMVSLFGIITTDKIHIHASFGNQLFKGYAGHLVKATISGACEIVLIETEEEIERKHSAQIGLDLLDL